MHTSTSPKPVTLLTGFLGAGKTTLLNAILSAKKEARFAIVENEVGEIGIDGELIIPTKDSFTELSNGCICCSLNDNFTDTLRTLSKRTDWDELLIEATGVAEPGGILAPFKQYPWTQKYFELPQVICVVDALHIHEQMAASDMAASQLAYADQVYISKSDRVTGEQLDEIKALARRLSPFATLHHGTKTDVPIESLFAEKPSQKPKFSLPALTTKPSLPKAHEQFDTISLDFDLDFNENQVFARLQTFLMLQSANVFRFKGIFHDPRNPNKLIIQSVMKTLHLEEGEPWQKDEPRESKFVFIGKNLQAKGFERMLKACLLPKK